MQGPSRGGLHRHSRQFQSCHDLIANFQGVGNGFDDEALRHVESVSYALEIRDQVGLPCVIRPSFTLGGTGGGIAYNREEYTDLVTRGIELSPVNEVLIEESVIGWKEYELEVMRDYADNVVISRC